MMVLDTIYPIYSIEYAILRPDILTISLGREGVRDQQGEMERGRRSERECMFHTRRREYKLRDLTGALG